MALVEHLIAQIPDAALRKAIEREVADLKKRLTWGLVFERHIPETTLLLDAPVRPGAIVWERRTAKPRRFRVRAVEGDELVVVAEAEGDTAPDDAETMRITRADVLVEKPFGEPVFPALTSLGWIRRGPADRPSHAVIEAENFHALQVLVLTYEGQADCVYLDPPYNTGASDWKYNNRFVDTSDAYRHSKWLSFMDKRLRLAARLLRDDGVLVVAIDENEHAPLVLLLGQIFRTHDITSVSIVHNPRGIQGDNFSYTNDYAVFVVPGKGRIAAREIPEQERDTRDLRDNGGESLRTNARNCFYPILVRDGAIVGFGDVPTDAAHPTGANEEMADGMTAIWPIDVQGVERKWRYARQTVEDITDWLSVRTVGRPQSRRLDIAITKPVGTHRTVWIDPRYDANAFGTKLIKTFAGVEFDFPKSLYNVRDVLQICTATRPDALIVDYFAGSGTTLHATMLLNAQDGGSRRCVLVTNNEVEANAARRLNHDGHFRGDSDYEAHGIFAAVTRPRITAAVTGLRPDEQPVEGAYLDRREYADGFPENVEFFRLDYLDPAEVELGLRFEALLPLWWLMAGGIGERGAIDPAVAPFALPPGSPYAFLFDAAGVPGLVAGLADRPDVTHAFITADTDDAFADLAEQLPAHLKTVLLYRTYLDELRGMVA